MTLAEAGQHIGARVMYQQGAGQPWHEEDFGVIDSVGDYYVYVQYDGETGTKATLPQHLQLQEPMVSW